MLRWLRLNDFEKSQKLDYIRSLRDSYKTREMQATLKNLVQGHPEEFREKILRQESSIYGIKKNGETYLKSNGEYATVEEIEKIQKNVDERMLRESPALKEHNLIFSAGDLLPDENYFLGVE